MKYLVALLLFVWPSYGYADVLTTPLYQYDKTTGAVSVFDAGNTWVTQGTLNATTHTWTPTVTAAAAGTLTGTTLAANVVNSSLTGFGTVTSGVWNASPISNTYLATMPANTTKCNATGATASPTDCSATTETALLNAFVGDSGSGGTKGLVPAPTAGQGAGSAYLSASGTFSVPPGSTTFPRSNVRQTVQGGPASFMPATSASLSVTTTGISSSVPLYVASAQGFNATGQNDLIFPVVSNLTFTCTASTQCYEFVNALTGAASTQPLVPIYQCGGALSTTSGQFSFDYCGNGTGGTGTQAGHPYVAYLGNGTNAVETPLVSVGECTAGTTTLSGCITYPYNGYYESPWTGTAPATTTLVNFFSNLGTVEATPNLIFEWVTATGGYSVGERFTTLSFDSASTTDAPNTISVSRLAATWTTGNTSAAYYYTKTAFVRGALASGATTARFKMVVKRNF